jgi:aldose 1-epimerase
VTWRHVVVPQPGWPTSLDCRVTYRLADDGLTVSTTAHNVGASRCLYGTGSHPYLSAGTATVDDARLTVPASSWFEVDERGLPIDRHPVDGTEHDLRESRPIGARVLDHAFGDLGRDDAGRCTVRLTAPDGAGVQLWVDSAYGYLQLFSGDTLPAGQARRGLAVEPMTCPPDAFNAGGGRSARGHVGHRADRPGRVSLVTPASTSAQSELGAVQNTPLATQRLRGAMSVGREPQDHSSTLGGWTSPSASTWT